MNYRNNHIKINAMTAMLLGILLTMPVLAADESGYALLLQSSPAHGGKGFPETAHTKQIGQEIP
jgi:hypothetical protein